MKTDDIVRVFLQGQNSHRTRQSYGEDLEDFRIFLSRKKHDVSKKEDAVRLLLSLDVLQAKAIATDYRNHMIEARKLSPSTVNRRLSVLRGVVRLANEAQIVPWSLFVKGLKRETYKDTKGPGDANIQKMFDYLQRSRTEKNLRDYAILRLINDRGMRREHVAGLMLKDVDLEGLRVRYRDKGDNEQAWKALAPMTATALKDWIGVRKGTKSGPLFTNFDRSKKGNSKGRLTDDGVYHVVRSTARLAGVPRAVWPHAIRHTAITRVVNNSAKHGLPLTVAKTFAGHARIETTMVYVDQDGKEDREGVRLATQVR